MQRGHQFPHQSGFSSRFSEFSELAVQAFVLAHRGLSKKKSNNRLDYVDSYAQHHQTREVCLHYELHHSSDVWPARPEFLSLNLADGRGNLRLRTLIEIEQ